MLTKKHLRSRKELDEHIIPDRGTAMLEVCQDYDVEPESMLYECVLLTKIAQDEMMRKYAAQFKNPNERPWTKKQKEMIGDDYDRLWDVLSEQCVNALRDAEWKIKHVKTEVEHSSRTEKDDDRPNYIN
jgi:hypothetical protein